MIIFVGPKKFAERECQFFACPNLELSNLAPQKFPTNTLFDSFGVKIKFLMLTFKSDKEDGMI